MLADAQQRFPDIKFRYCEAREAFQRVLSQKEKAPCKLSLSFEGNVLKINSDKKTFGPQPFFVIKTLSGEFYYDNLDFEEPFQSWAYTFDQATFELNTLKNIGVATCDDAGNTTVVDYDVLMGSSSTHFV
jgi:hypothetical protein